MATITTKRSISDVYNDTKACVPALPDTSTDGEACVPVMKKSKVSPKFSWWPSTVHYLLCTPPNKAAEALHVIRNTVGINTASTVSIDDGVIFVMTTSDKSFRKITTCFDGPDWVVTPHDCYRDKCIPSNFAIQNYTFDSKDGTGSMAPINEYMTAFMRDMNMSDAEKKNIPVLKWLYSSMGMNRFTYNSSDRLYFIFSYDLLKSLGYYGPGTNNPSKVIDMFETKEDSIYVSHYSDVLGVNTLPNGGRVVNPLYFRPSGDRVLVVEDNHVTTALGRCASPIAKALVDLMSRFFNIVLKRDAVQHARTVGVEKFQDTLVASAESELLKSTSSSVHVKELMDTIKDERIKRLEAEKLTMAERARAIEADKRTVEAEKKALTERMMAREFEFANMPIPTKFEESVYSTRTGCAGIYTHDDRYMSVHYTDMRSGALNRRTLEDSASRLPFTRKGGKRMLIKLIGATRVIDTRSIFDEGLSVNTTTHTRKSGMIDVGTTKEGLEKLINGPFLHRAKRGFALGLVWAEGSEEGEPKVLFKNDCIIDNMEYIDRQYCRQFVNNYKLYF